MQRTMSVSKRGQVTLGVRFAGRHYSLEELRNGGLLLHPVADDPRPDNIAEPSTGRVIIRVIEVEQVVQGDCKQRRGS